MRIVIDLQAAQNDSRFRGVGRYCKSLAIEMTRQATNRGHEIILVTSDRFPETIPGLIRDFSSVCKASQFRAFHVAHGAVQGTVSENESRLRAAEIAREDFIASLNPDFVHVSSLFEGSVDDAVVSVGRGSSRVPTAVTLYDIIPYVLSDIYITNDQFQRYYDGKIRSLREADLLLSISEHSKRDAVEHLGIDVSKIVNISAGIDADFRPVDIAEPDVILARYGIQTGTPFVLYVPGGFDPRKNFGNLFDAFARLPRGGQQLVIASNVRQHERDALYSLASKCGVSESDLILTGYVPECDLIALYNLCRINIFPSLYEGFGLPALEAMACGAPSIGSNTSSLPEVIGRADALFDPHSADSIADKMRLALTDETFRDSLHRHAIAHARTFSWTASAERALDAIQHYAGV
ncbi:glycosyltransferase involved in cell wall biosynthesis [Paraburkholderia atlantica]|uniref:glycosyltransferase family 4 protein n=1 Tax=Paraburkholderia atlantica TaxID=2654982 RepID=UPI00128B5CC8|nr:glycosyltransferase family 1 protein [Paraburkholderia atlantica]MPW04330.1 glycosyltransferase [Paraburkholderia atlantica]